MTVEWWFLLVYGGLLATLVLATVAASEQSLHDREASFDVGDVGSTELAVLRGGPERAALAAAARLRGSSIWNTVDGRLVASGPLPGDAGELERELFETVSRQPGIAGVTLLHGAADSHVVRRTVTKLIAAGLLPQAGEARRMRIAARCAAALAAAGALVVLVLVTSGHGLRTAQGAVGAALTVMATVLWWLARRRADSTAPGRQLIERLLADQQTVLRPAGENLAFAVAMVGGGELWSADPAFAAALDVPVHWFWDMRLTFGGDGGWGCSCDGCGCGGGCG